LPEPYTADLEETVDLVELDAPSFREALPDANVTRGSTPASAQTAVIVPYRAAREPVLLAHPPAQEVKHRWVEVRTAPDRELVAVIELLSPTNKRAGRADYLAKRRALMAQTIHLIEIDLLLEGACLPMDQPLPAGDYFALISRADHRPFADTYSWAMREPLPPVPVPLRTPDPDHWIDLQPVFAHTYRGNAYRRKLDYGKPPRVKLAELDQTWLAGIVAAAGVRA